MNEKLEVISQPRLAGKYTRLVRWLDKNNFLYKISGRKIIVPVVRVQRKKT